MALKRRPSVRTRMKAEDVSSWVQQNQPTFSLQNEQHHVRFDAPPAVVDDGSDTESVESLTEKPVYKDGGYGWFVVVCSFLMHAICDGTSFCFGILYVMIQNRFKADRVKSSVAASLFLSLPLCLSPIAGIVCDLAGCRKTIMLGGLICAISCSLAVFCNGIGYFNLFFGFGCGVGMSFIYNAAIVIVTYYFNKKRGIATSLAVAGTGCGTFGFPIYISGSTRVFGSVFNDLQSVLIAYAAGYGLIAIMGFLIKDVEWESDTTAFKMRKFEKSSKALKEAQENNTGNKNVPLRHAISLPNLNLPRAEAGSIQSVCDITNDKKNDMPARSKSVALFENQGQTMPSIPEYSMLNTRLANLEHLDLELANSPCTTVKATRRRVISKVSMSVDQINELDDEDFKANLVLTSTESSDETDDESSSDDSEMSNDGDSSSSELTEKHDEPTAKLLNKNLTVATIRAASSAPTSARPIRNSLAPGGSNISGCRVIASNAMPNTRYATNLLTMGKVPSAPMLVARQKRRNIFLKMNLAILKRMTENEIPMYRTVLKCVPYRWLLASVKCLYLMLDVPYVVFFDYALELGIAVTLAKAIYSVIGLANLVSTIIYGKIADYEPLRHHITTIYFISMVGVASVLLSAVFVTKGIHLALCGVFFGLFVTANYVLQSILITICFDDMNMFQGAYSLVGMVEGFASLIGPCVFAKMREYSGSYTPVFVTAFIAATFSAFFAYKFSVELAKQNAEKDKESEEEYEFGINDRYLQNGHGNGNTAENRLLLV